MRVFVSEYLCSGAWPEPELPSSLAREGRGMLLALLGDLSALPDVTLCTTWDARLGEFPFGRGATGSASANYGLTSNCNALAEPVAPDPVAPDAVACGSPLNVEHIVINDAGDEAAVFQRLAAECDATYVIAPELDDLLTRRVQSVLDAGGRSLNASPAGIAVCSDKWETYERLSAAGIATVTTAFFDAESSSQPFDFPLVLKPRFGAGSQNTLLIHDANELSSQLVAVSSQLRAIRDPNNRKSKIENRKFQMIVQPYLPGRTLSVAAVFRSDGTLREIWPVGEQRLSTDGRFTYLGGRLPAERIDSQVISNLISEISTRIPGLRGYIGFDVIWPDDAPLPVIVDINPRLTTSFLGYRALSNVNLAGRILWPDGDWPSLDWQADPIAFSVDGTIARCPADRGD